MAILMITETKKKDPVYNVFWMIVGKLRRTQARVTIFTEFFRRPDCNCAKLLQCGDHEKGLYDKYKKWGLQLVKQNRIAIKSVTSKFLASIIDKNPEQLKGNAVL